MRTELFERFPELELTLPWCSLGRFPTPVERAPALGSRVWVKRDDLSGVRYGGNKVRKLELVLADALARDRRTIVTIGAMESNHVIATGVYARALGFTGTHAVLAPQPRTDGADDKLATVRALSVRATAVACRALVPFALVHRMMAAGIEGRGRPYLIGPGASSPLGTIGYVNAGLELAGQIARGEAPPFDVVYVPLGSGGTVAGLLLGLRLGGLATRVRAVRVVPPPWSTPWLTCRLARRTTRLLRRLGARLPAGVERFGAGDLDDVGDQLGRGYAFSTAAAQAAVVRAADAGLDLETTYSGKACAALLAHTDADAGKNVLFWNTYCVAPATESLA